MQFFSPGKPVMLPAMKLLCLQPLRIYKRWPMPEDFTGLVSSMPTLAFPQLAGALPGHEIRLMDGLAGEYALSDLSRNAGWAEAVLINAHSSVGALNVEANLAHIRKQFPGTPVILGGPHATVYDLEWIEKGADYVVRNEGERTISALIGALSRGDLPDDLAGLTCRTARGPRRNPDRELVADIDDLPMPDWGLLDPALYHFPFPLAGYSTTIETSRGCEGRCSFCTTRAMWSGRHRFKSAQRVLEEFEILHKHGYRRFWIADDNFGANPERDVAIYEGLLRRNMTINFGAMIRADSIYGHPEVISLAARAGFRMAFVGMESRSQRLLGRVGKGIAGTSHDRVFDILRRNGVFAAGFFVVGHPDETDAEAEDTFTAATRVCDYPIISIFEPRKGTEDFDRCAASSDLPSSDMFYHNTVDFIPSRRSLLARYRRFFARYLTHPRQLAKAAAGNPVQRAFFRHLYANMARSTLAVTPQRLAHPWRMVRDMKE